MDSILQVIKQPLVTERATRMKADTNTYVFVVDPRATKPEIREAVEKLFKVDVRRVRTAILPGKLRRMGSRQPGYRPDWKKAMVTLKAGQEIQFTDEGK